MAISLVQKRMDLAKMLAPIFEPGLAELGFECLLTKFYCLVIDRLFDNIIMSFYLIVFLLALVKISNQ
jgi:hypothetical protein